jgi:hypothetical protein
LDKDKKKTSDGVWRMEDWDISDVNTGSASEMLTVDGMSYSFGELEFETDQKLREKYPALQDAWDHYNNVKKMCEAKEQEDEN